MPRTSQKRLTDELNTVVKFLNRDPETLPRGLVFDGLGGGLRKQRSDEWHSLRYVLTDLLAPNLLVPRKWKPELRKQQAAFYNRVAPKVGLISVLERLNANAIKPRWRGVSQPKRLAKIAIPGFTGSVVKEEFVATIWQAIARLLETGDIFWIGQCPVCQAFFAKNRDWQKCCPKAQCRKRYENQLAADRQAKIRRTRKRKAK